MLSSKSSEHHQINSSLQIKENDKFYSRLLSKETINPSFRVYYGVASGAVPFMWESQPGTPKHMLMSSTDHSLPPLTPPPSYYSSPRNHKHSKKGHKKSNSFMHHIIPKLSLSKPTMQSSKSCNSSTDIFHSYSSSSSSSSSCSSSTMYSRRPRRFSFSSRGDDEESDDGSSRSSMCFGARSYSVMVMKNALMSIVGHGSSQHVSAA